MWTMCGQQVGSKNEVASGTPHSLYQLQLLLPALMLADRVEKYLSRSATKPGGLLP